MGNRLGLSDSIRFERVQEKHLSRSLSFEEFPANIGENHTLCAKKKTKTFLHILV